MTPEQQGQAIAEARLNGRKLTGYPGAVPESVDAAYVVQEHMAAAMGQPRAGWKVGCTNAAARAALGLDQPFYGPLFAPALVEAPARLAVDDTALGIMEVEIAIRMGRDVPDGAEGDDVRAAIATVHPAIEVVAKRLPGGPADKAEWVVADGAFNASLVLGPGVAFDPDMDLSAEATGMWIDGEKVAEGGGGFVDTGPLGVLVWLARALDARGMKLKAGDVISTGLTTPVITASPGQVVEGRYATLGRVEVRLASEG